MNLIISLLTLIGCVLGQWQVLYCNNPDSGTPEMKAAFEQTYYESTIAQLNLGYTFNSENNLYEKIIPGPDLRVRFDTDECTYTTTAGVQLECK